MKKEKTNSGPGAPGPSCSPAKCAELDQAPWYHRLRDYIWGYDFFISYHWASGGAYAVSLAAQLRERGYDVFLDRTEFAMGDKWKNIGEIALRNTQRLVLIASREAVLESKPVEHEILKFTDRGRQCIPIFFGDTFAKEKLRHPGKFAVLERLPDDTLYIEDSIDNLPIAPARIVVEKLSRAKGIMRRRRVRTIIALTVIIALIMFTVFAVISRNIAIGARNDAENRLRSANSRLITQAAKEMIANDLSLIQVGADMLARAIALDPTPDAVSEGQSVLAHFEPARSIRSLPATTILSGPTAGGNAVVGIGLRGTNSEDIDYFGFRAERNGPTEEQQLNVNIRPLHLAVHPNGQRIAAYTEDGRIVEIRFDVTEESERVQVFDVPGLPKWPDGLLYLPGDSGILSISQTQSILLDGKNRDQRMVAMEIEAPFAGVVAGGDMVLGIRDRRLVRFGFENLKQLATYDLPERFLAPLRLAVARDSNRIVLGSKPLTVLEYDSNGFELVAEIDVGLRPIFVAISPDGKTVAGRGLTGGIFSADVRSGKVELMSGDLSRSSTGWITVTAKDVETIATSPQDGFSKWFTWPARPGHRIERPVARRHYSVPGPFLWDGLDTSAIIVQYGDAGSNDIITHSLEIWDLKQRIRVFERPLDYGLAIQGPNGQLVYTDLSQQATFRIANVSQPVEEKLLDTEDIVNLRYSAAGSCLAIAQRNSSDFNQIEVRLFDAAGSQSGPIRIPQEHYGVPLETCTELIIMPEDDANEPNAYLADVRSLETLVQWPEILGLQSPILTLKDGARFAVVQFEESNWLVRLDKAGLHRLKQLDGSVVAVDTDAGLFFASDADQDIVILTSTGKILNKYLHTEPIQGIAVSESHVVTSSDQMRIFDRQSGRLLARYELNKRQSVAFSANGLRVAEADVSGFWVRPWDAEGVRTAIQTKVRPGIADDHISLLIGSARD